MILRNCLACSRFIFKLFGIFLLITLCLTGCSPKSFSGVSSSEESTSVSSSKQSASVNWTDNADANSFISKYNEANPYKPLKENSVKSYRNDAGAAADVSIGDTICQFSYNGDGDSYFLILSDLPLNKKGRSIFFKQASEYLSIRYDLSLQTTQEIMNMFNEKDDDDEDDKQYRTSNGLVFVLSTGDASQNYELNSFKEIKY